MLAILLLNTGTAAGDIALWCALVDRTSELCEPLPYYIGEGLFHTEVLAVVRPDNTAVPSTAVGLARGLTPSDMTAGGAPVAGMFPAVGGQKKYLQNLGRDIRRETLLRDVVTSLDLIPVTNLCGK